MGQAIWRDQVCPINNKGGFLITHPLFVIYKPDPFSLTAHLRHPPPPPSVGFLQAGCPVSPSQSPNESDNTDTPSVGENLGVFRWMLFNFFEAPNFVWESGWHEASTKSYRLSEGIRFLYHKKGCVINTFTPTWRSQHQLFPIHLHRHDVGYVKSEKFPENIRRN